MKRVDIEFPDGDFYDCHDSEQLTWDDPIEAIEHALDSWAHPGADMAAIIREHGALRVTVYRRTKMPDDWLTSTADYLLVTASERFDEEYGDPDGDSRLPHPNVEAALPEMVAALRTLLKGVEPWHCDDVGHVDLSAEDTEALMREHNPDWFEDLTKAGAK